MGLLSRAGRRVGSFLSGAGDSVSSRMSDLNYTDRRFSPLGDAAGGAILGAPVGAGIASANGQDPTAGMVAGMAGGGALGAAGAVARLGAGALRGGMKNMAAMEPAALAQQIRQIAKTYGPQEAQAALRELEPQIGPDGVQEVMAILQAG